jgi:hypothetical protein
MKKKIFLSFMMCLFIGVGNNQISAQTSTEILDKAIAYHDPLQKWPDYSGKVHLLTVFADGRFSGGEIIEIGTKDNYYQCTSIVNKTIKGIKNGVYFREVKGNSDPGKEIINKYNLGDANIAMSKGWHYFHFGMLMELKASGLVPEDGVKKMKFQGNDCYAIRFTYNENKIKNEFYKGTNWTFYIDPVNYSLKGFKAEGENLNFHAAFAGILTINDLKLPLCRTYYNNKDNSFYMVDVFTNQ